MRKPPRRIPVPVSVFALLAFGLLAPARALDGRADVWANWQSGGTGLTEFEARTLEENYRIAERYQASRNLNFFGNLAFRRRQLSSTSVLGTSDTRLEATLPSVGLSYRSGGFRFALNALGTRRDTWDTADRSTRDEYANLNGWVVGDAGWGLLELRAQETASWRNSTGLYRESREHLQIARAELRPTVGDNIQYRYTHNRQDNITSSRELDQVSHQLTLRSDHGFVDNRGQFSLNARGSHNVQSTVWIGDEQLVIVPPLWGGVSLDDTPEFQDPLEPDPVLIPGLFDGDRDTPTVINIGDSAPVVRQFGGDYRNFIFDFGQVEEMSQVILYIDREVRFPELMRWLVYVSDDPEGRDWGDPLPPGTVSVRYEQLENQRQGWQVSFTQPIGHIRVKLVNFKLGLTEDDIFVNEMEVLRADTSSQGSRIDDGLWRYWIDGEVSFDITRAFEVRYAGNLLGRYDDDGQREADGQTHLFGMRWRLADWTLDGSHLLTQESRNGIDDVDSRTQRISLNNRQSRKVRGGVSYTRTDDRSFRLQQLTQSVRGTLGWTIAPRLVFNQSLSYGLRDTEDGLENSESWVSRTEFRGAPRPSMEVVLIRTDRWVSRQAGTGFTTYNETALTLNWAILPLVSLVSQLRYQVRETDDLLVRNTLSWTPLPGGSMSLRLYVLDYQDTRTDYFQRGGGFNATWKPRPRLRFEGSYEATLLKQNELRNTPTIWNLRGTWTF